jgi:hypothetical protein
MVGQLARLLWWEISVKLCTQISTEPAGLCADLSPDSDSWANFGSRTATPDQNTILAPLKLTAQRKSTVHHDGEPDAPALLR